MTRQTPYSCWFGLALTPLLLMALCSPVFPQDVILVVKEQAPKGQCCAWTYPAETMLEGPEGTAVIAFKASFVRNASQYEYQRVLWHEMGHVKYDLDAIRRGEKVNCKRAKAYAKANGR